MENLIIKRYRYEENIIKYLCLAKKLYPKIYKEILELNK
jgi:hypothetical protein